MLWLIYHISLVSVFVYVVADMEQLYEMWLQSQKPGWSEESSSATRDNGKQIHMPTDYAEEVVWKLEQHSYYRTPLSRSSYSDTALVCLRVSCTHRQWIYKTLTVKDSTHTQGSVLSHVCMLLSVLLRLSIFTVLDYSLVFQVKIVPLKNASQPLQSVPVHCALSSCLNTQHVLHVKFIR